MAIRKHLSHDDKTRELIQTTQLVKRLNLFANGEVEMTRDQITAIDILLKKTLPNLMAMEVSGNPDKPVHIINDTDKAIIERFKQQIKEKA